MDPTKMRTDRLMESSNAEHMTKIKLIKSNRLCTVYERNRGLPLRSCCASFWFVRSNSVSHSKRQKDVPVQCLPTYWQSQVGRERNPHLITKNGISQHRNELIWPLLSRYPGRNIDSWQRYASYRCGTLETIARLARQRYRAHLPDHGTPALRGVLDRLTP